VVNRLVHHHRDFPTESSDTFLSSPGPSAAAGPSAAEDYAEPRTPTERDLDGRDECARRTPFDPDQDDEPPDDWLIPVSPGAYARAPVPAESPFAERIEEEPRRHVGALACPPRVTRAKRRSAGEAETHARIRPCANVQPQSRVRGRRFRRRGVESDLPLRGRTEPRGVLCRRDSGGRDEGREDQKRAERSANQRHP
jgi:hypothetical protein